MNNLKVGDKVRFKNHIAHITYPEFYPPIGTVGIIQADPENERENKRANIILVQWKNGSTSGFDVWKCGTSDVVLCEGKVEE